MKSGNSATNKTAGTHQPIGKVLSLSGIVQAQAADGTIRVLEINSPIYADERIITGTDGSVSIIFGDAEHSRLDLGRMSDVLIDDNVFNSSTHVDIHEATAAVEKIQQAILKGGFDPT